MVSSTDPNHSEPAIASSSPVRRVLMLTHRLPYPPDRGDRIRSYHLLKQLSQYFDVSLACTSDEPAGQQDRQVLGAITKRIAIEPLWPSYSKVKACMALMTGQPITPCYYYRKRLVRKILQWHREAPFDAVLTFCTGMVLYTRWLCRQLAGSSRLPLQVLDIVDVDSLKWQALARNSRLPMRWVYATEAKRLRRVEAGRHDHFDDVTVISPAEAKAYRDHVGSHQRLTVVGNGVDLNYFSPLPDTKNPVIVFVGVLNYKPNIDGIAWFVRHVMGPLQQRVTHAKLLIVGRHATHQVQQLAANTGVEVIGSVPDVRRYIQQAGVVVAPLQVARGVQNKVLEAMACGRAVVCSPSAAQGINATDGQHLLIADKPPQWLDQLDRVLTDTTFRQRMARSARQHVERTYTWEHQLQPMINLLRGRRGPV